MKGKGNIINLALLICLFLSSVSLLAQDDVTQLLIQAKKQMAGKSYDQAISIIKQAQKKAPVNAKIYYFLGSAYHLKGQNKEADRNFQKVLKLTEKNVDSEIRTDSLKKLVAIRQNGTTYKFYQWLHDLAPLQDSYKYILIFIIIATGATLLIIPFSIINAKSLIRYRQMLPEIAFVELSYSDDLERKNEEMKKIYQKCGISISREGSVFAAFVVFVLIVLVTTNNFSPQLLLDKSSFLWVKDITKFSIWIFLLWLLISGLSSFRRMKFMGQSLAMVGCSMVIFGVFFFIIAWFLHWPSHSFIFWAIYIMIYSICSEMLLLIFSLKEKQSSALIDK